VNYSIVVVDLPQHSAPPFCRHELIAHTSYPYVRGRGQLGDEIVNVVIYGEGGMIV
jgi:hypothetical protein